MSLHNIKRGLSGTSRTGIKVKLIIGGDVIQAVTLQTGKYLTVEAQEFILVQAGKTVRLEVGDWSREYTVPTGRVMVVRYTYDDEEEPL